jgi:hypothetical protein
VALYLLIRSQIDACQAYLTGFVRWRIQFNLKANTSWEGETSERNERVWRSVSADVRLQRLLLKPQEPCPCTLVCNGQIALDVVAGFGFQALQFGLGKLDVTGPWRTRSRELDSSRSTTTLHTGQ